jgi:hypothetical protein
MHTQARMHVDKSLTARNSSRFPVEVLTFSCHDLQLVYQATSQRHCGQPMSVDVIIRRPLRSHLYTVVVTLDELVYVNKVLVSFLLSDPHNVMYLILISRVHLVTQRHWNVYGRNLAHA